MYPSPIKTNDMVASLYFLVLLNILKQVFTWKCSSDKTIKNSVSLVINSGFLNNFWKSNLGDYHKTAKLIN